MVSGQSHTVLKLIFHTNPAMHPDFGRYQKSNFRLHVSGDFALPAYALDASGGAEEGMADAGPADAGQPWDVDRDGEESLALELEADGSPVPERDIENGRGASGADGVVSPSRLSAACNMLADLMDGAFGGTSDSESPPPEPVPRSSKKKKKKGKKGSNTAASTAGDDSPAQYYSAGTSPATHQSFIHAASGLPPRTPGAGLGSAHSSAANLARNERRWEVGSSYRDGWSDGEDLTQLVGATGEESSTSPRNRERRTCQADASVQASFPYEATDDEGGHVGLMMGGELGDEEANGSPSSYVQVESEPKFGIEDSTDFENIPQMRTCSTQTAKVAALTPARYPWPAGTGRTSGGPSAPTTGVVVVVGADDTLEDIEAAMGPLGKGAVSPQGMATGAGPGFPPSRLFGYPGVVFEVLPCGSIASLTLFKAS